MRKFIRAFLCVLLGCETVTVRPPQADPEVEAITEEETSTPSSIRAVRLGVGTRASCAALADGTLRCWGSAADGLLGDADGPGPVIVESGLSNVARVSVGPVRACVAADGTLRCHGRASAARDSVALEPTPIPGLQSGVDVSLAEEHGCAIDRGGNVFCFGNSAWGRTGSRLSFLRVAARVALEGATSIATGRMHSCASTAEAVFCWGHGSGGRLGTGSVRYYTEAPVKVEGVGAADGLSAHPLGAQTCALLSGDEIACWGVVGGDESAASLGALPVRLPPAGEAITRVVVGLVEVLAVAESGALYRYIAEIDGQSARYAEPTRVPDLGPVIDAGMGLAHTCVLTSEGQVMCWGLGVGGRLGDGSGESSERPVVVQWETT